MALNKCTLLFKEAKPNLEKHIQKDLKKKKKRADRRRIECSSNVRYSQVYSKCNKCSTFKAFEETSGIIKEEETEEESDQI